MSTATPSAPVSAPVSAVSSNHRLRYFEVTPEQVLELNDATWKRARLNGMLISNLVDKDTLEPVPRLFGTFDFAAQRLGLEVVFADQEFQRDADGGFQLDEKGRKIPEGPASIPDHAMAFTVTVEGLVDCNGTAIPKGKQYFRANNQPANRPLTLSNVDSIEGRLNKWALNGETMIEDEAGTGQNEQHRLWAIVRAKLTGKPMPERGIDIYTLDGVALELASTIDSGKPNTGKDQFGSDPMIAEAASLRTYSDYQNDTYEGYGSETTTIRKRITGDIEATAKLLVLRLGGKNVNASIGGGANAATEIAYKVATKLLPNLDELVSMAYAYIASIPLKNDATKKRQRPVNWVEVSTAIALHALRDHSPILMGLSKNEEGTPLDEVEPVVLPVDDYREFLHDILIGSINQEGPLAHWCVDRVGNHCVPGKTASFAQICMALNAWINGEEVSPEFNRTKASGESSQKEGKYYRFGGADKGPAPKKVKAE